MVRFLIRVGVTLGAAALGLLAATLLVHNFSVDASGFVVTVLVFAVAQLLLTPLVTRLVGRHAPVLEGGVGIISVLVALVVVNFVPGAVSVTGLSAWILSALVIWLVTGVATMALSALAARSDRKGGREGTTPGH